MPSIHSLLPALKTTYPDIRFIPGDGFSWSPKDATVYYVDDDARVAFLLHEVGHAILEHSGYAADIGLLAMERDAWKEATVLAATHGITIDEELIQATLDSYREWLHDRSTCPKCQATGMQQAEKQYACPACRQQWRVNEARLCALRRYSL